MKLKKPGILLFLVMAWVFFNVCSRNQQIMVNPLDSPGIIYEEVAERVVKKSVDFGPFLEDQEVQTGVASWYGGKFHGRRTANGEIYNKHRLTAAHRMLPFNSIVEVVNLDNRKKIIVRINDRGPFVKNRIIDLCLKAARMLNMTERGTAPVRIRVIQAVSVSGSAMSPDYGKGYCLQAGAFAREANARSLLKRLNADQNKLKFDIRFQNGFYKIISEMISTRQSAEKWLRILVRNGFDVFIKEYY
ncbi:MAG: septal ring lytic transglycosylase RlpA family protein [Candidatus Aminicenantes bacterium]|nr:septal ring lytic transglycosylase RlpA family protein [Candidatus Aminicenantes bacterium]